MPSSSSKKTGKWLATGGYYVALVAFGLVVSAFGPALPSLAASTNSDLSQISVHFAARALGFFLGAFLIGRLYDSIAGHPLMAGALVVTAITTALLPLLPSLGSLVAISVVLGMATGLINVGANTLLTWVHRDRVGPWMNGMHFVNGVGSFLSPILITRVTATTGEITWAFWIIALFALLPAGWLLFIRSPAVPSVSKDGRDNGLNRGLVRAIFLVFLLYYGAQSGFGGWIYTYAATLHPGFVVLAGYLTASFWGALSIGRLLAIPISMRFSPRMILVLDFLGCLAGVGLVLIGAFSFSVLAIGTVVVGLSLASIFPTLLAFVGNRTKLRASVTGWFFAATSIGGMSVPWLMGQLFENQGPRWAMGTLFVVLLVAVGIFASGAFVGRTRFVKVRN